MHYGTNKPYQVSVPATSANIGVGFDSAGIAFKLYNTFTFNESDSFKVVGCEEKYASENNLVIKSYKYIFDILNEEYIPVYLNIKADIPVSRGLGSSATCIIAGVMAANHFLEYPLSSEECLYHIAQIEGHPDNVTAAYYGGMITSFIENQKVYCSRFKISKKLHFAALIPDFELSTSKARSVLPEKLEYHDAVNNLSRFPFLLKALENGDMEILKIAIKDRLHEPYRKPLIDGYDTIEKMIDEHSLVYLSGAGPTIMCIYDNDDSFKKIKDNLPGNYTCHQLKISENGAAIYE